MQKISHALAILIVTLAIVQSDNSSRIVCYYDSSSVNRPGLGKYQIADIPADMCTHIIYSFIGITNGTNEVLVLNPKIDVDSDGFRNFTSLRSKYPDVKFMVALGGRAEDGSKYSQMSSENTSRAIFVNNIIDFLETYNFDGLDLDWEYPGAKDRNGTVSDKDNFLHLVHELKAAFSKDGKKWELTAAVPLTESKIQAGYHVSELCQCLDAIHAMSYDLRGVWYNQADEHSPLYNSSINKIGFEKYNVNSGLSLLEEKGCPANKLVVGIPFYGRSFTLPTGSTKYEVGTKINITAGRGDPGPYTKEKGLLAYYEICSEIIKPISNWTNKWDEQGKCPYAYKGTQWVGYEDKKSVEIKMNWIKKKGYLGATAWSIDMDDFQGMCGKKNTLIEVIYEHMSSYTVPTPSTGANKINKSLTESKTDLNANLTVPVATLPAPVSMAKPATSKILPAKSKTSPTQSETPTPQPKTPSTHPKTPSTQLKTSSPQSKTPVPASKPIEKKLLVPKSVPGKSTSNVTSRSSSRTTLPEQSKFLILFTITSTLSMYFTALLQLSR